ncbi:hypothetical protein F183_A33190 [Bryobacterales bacterium F-183]|nr:hypothetical protein F183_A33190 [Bryobacterales bacterium F-183]
MMQQHQAEASLPKKLDTSPSMATSAVVAAGAAMLASSLHAQNTVTDVSLLNYALLLEQLEANFYTQGLRRFSSADFNTGNFSQNLGNAGDFYGDSITGDVYGNLLLIRNHEQTHVRALERTIRTLGGTPRTNCNGFSFTYNTVDEFLAVGKLLEDTGVSAYAGAINMIRDPQLVTTAATIATVEARHAAYLRLITGDSPFPSAFDPTKTMQEILTAAAPFLGSCTV